MGVFLFWRRGLAKFIFTTHMGILIYIIIGGLVTPLPWLWVHFILLPLTLLGWFIFDNECILTRWQLQLEDRAEEGEAGAFVKGLTEKVGFEFSDRQLLYIIYGVMAASFALTTCRLFL